MRSAVVPRCEHCGGPINLPHYAGAKRKYCSMHCSQAAVDAARRERMTKTMHGHCYTCGAELICPECEGR